MSEPFVGEIRMFAGNFAPRGWAFCDGQLLEVSQNDALFSLLGTIYGGDGRTTFGLPDMRGRIPVHAGQGPGLSPRRLGSALGSETVTLTTNELPPHGHTWSASGGNAANTSPGGNGYAATLNADQYRDTASDLRGMSASAVTDTGGSRAHSNVMPFQCVHFIIALFGIYPSRN